MLKSILTAGMNQPRHHIAKAEKGRCKYFRFGCLLGSKIRFLTGA